LGISEWFREEFGGVGKAWYLKSGLRIRNLSVSLINLEIKNGTGPFWQVGRGRSPLIFSWFSSCSGVHRARAAEIWLKHALSYIKWR